MQQAKPHPVPGFRPAFNCSKATLDFPGFKAIDGPIAACINQEAGKTVRQRTCHAQLADAAVELLAAGAKAGQPRFAATLLDCAAVMPSAFVLAQRRDPPSLEPCPLPA